MKQFLMLDAWFMDRRELENLEKKDVRQNLVHVKRSQDPASTETLTFGFPKVLKLNGHHLSVDNKPGALQEAVRTFRRI